MNYYLAVDMGASSGRHILSHLENGKIILEEVYRFDNAMEKKDGHLVWDTEKFLFNILEGLKKCREVGKIPVTMSIDTWGVDYALLDGEDKLIGDVYAYRDSRTDEPMKMIDKAIPYEKIYKSTGIQKLAINTIYQLYADKLSGKADKAYTFLMIPDYLNFLLTGNKFNEYSNASTTGLLDAKKRDWDMDLINTLGLKASLFKKLYFHGQSVGKLKKEIVEKVGFDLEVVLAATHDTASAVMSVPSKERAIYISSGTWSLIGTQSKEPIINSEALINGFTNEGAYNKEIRFLRNIMGLWMIQCVRKEYDKKYSFAQLASMAESNCDFPTIVDCNAECFLAPESMIKAIRDEAERTGQKVPDTPGEIAACVFNSLAEYYNIAANGIEKITGEKFGEIYIVGGGSQNNYLNAQTAKRARRKVFAGPAEATAIGNVLVQLLRSGEVKNIEEGKDLIVNSFDIKEFNA